MRGSPLLWAAIAVAVLPAACGLAQSTQGILLGRVQDSITNLPIESAAIECVNAETRQTVNTLSGTNGFYAIPALSPGTFAVTVTSAAYQTKQARAVQITVASRVELNFSLRPLSDLWEAGRFRTWRVPGSDRTLAVYGPDVDTSRIAVFRANDAAVSPLDTSRSDVIGSYAINNLPLAGRDVYTMLLLLPGVTADAGTTRGLGLSAFGQRPSSTEYLLDGADNNALLTTGPLNTAVPEFVQEYRVSIGSFTAEFGRTSGFVANAMTRSGSLDWHATGFSYLENQRLNANGFQENAGGLPRNPMTQMEGGFTGGGPVLRGKLFLSGGFDKLRTKRLADPASFALPTASYIRSLDPGSYAGAVFRRSGLPPVPEGAGDVALTTIAPPGDFARSDVFVRLDSRPTKTDRLFGRFLRDSQGQPDFLYSPYANSSTPFGQVSLSAAGAWTRQVNAALVNEGRAARMGDAVRLVTPVGDIPQLSLLANAGIVKDGQTLLPVLPGPQNSYNYRNRAASWEFGDVLTRTSGSHVWKAGGNWLQRSIALNLAFTGGGYLLFDTFSDLAAGIPDLLQLEVDRFGSNFAPVSPDRNYRYRQAYVFAQDSFRVTDRLNLDFGLRYEWYGAPVNTGAAKDTLIALAPSRDLPGALGAALAVTPPGGAGQRLFLTSGRNLGPRIGLAWSVGSARKTVLRASYGIFYDRPFDNLWENAIQNRYGTASFQGFSTPLPAQASIAGIESLGTYTSSTQIVNGLLFQPGLRAPRVQNAFVGVQRPVGEWAAVEANALASRGRSLVTTDIVNRPHSLPIAPDNLFGYLNPSLNQLDYRANQGRSQYVGLSATARFRHRAFFGQISYTWSHSQDNQSEPLANAFFNLSQFSQARNASPFFSAFTTQFDGNHDWANSDFDQRHNLVAYAAWTPRAHCCGGLGKRAFANWTVSGLAAARSGLPFSVRASQVAGISSVFVINERADLIDPSHVWMSQPGPGGTYLLNPAAFAKPSGIVGNTGRNEFIGPGLFSADLSVAREFPLGAMREGARILIRADAYNFLNHANLNNPNPFYAPGSPSFGLALKGRMENPNGFPLSLPLRESARTIQLMLRLQF